jgi:pimeloyl-ACP methyl ester carboxylesterase
MVAVGSNEIRSQGRPFPLSSARPANLYEAALATKTIATPNFFPQQKRSNSLEILRNDTESVPSAFRFAPGFPFAERPVAFATGLLPSRPSSNETPATALPQQTQAPRDHAFSLAEIIKPRQLFEKILAKFLYPASSNIATLIEQERCFRNLRSSGVPVEQHIIKTADGHSIELWFARNASSEARTKVFLHGNGSTIASFASQAETDFQQGNNICLFSYRGYSGNPGKPSEQGWIDDTNSVINFLINEQEVNSQNMDFVAHSLGCAVLLNSLAERDSQEQFGNLTLLAPFKSVRDMIKAKLKILPQFIINWLTNAWNNHEAIAKLKGKVADIKIVHGTKDILIPITQARELHQEAARNGIKSEFVEVNCGHNQG